MPISTQIAAHSAVPYHSIQRPASVAGNSGYETRPDAPFGAHNLAGRVANMRRAFGVLTQEPGALQTMNSYGRCNPLGPSMISMVLSCRDEERDICDEVSLGAGRGSCWHVVLTAACGGDGPSTSASPVAPPVASEAPTSPSLGVSEPVAVTELAGGVLHVVGLGDSIVETGADRGASIVDVFASKLQSSGVAESLAWTTGSAPTTASGWTPAASPSAGPTRWHSLRLRCPKLLMASRGPNHPAQRAPPSTVSPSTPTVVGSHRSVTTSRRPTAFPTPCSRRY